MVNLLLVFDVARFFPVIAVLVYAAYQDFKSGVVRNRTWLYAPIGFVLTLVEWLFVPQLIFISIVSVVITFIISFALFGLCGVGGADAKAFMLIAVSTPLTPLIRPLVTVMPIFAIFIASMAAIVALAFRFKKKNNKVRFLPYLLLGYVLACLV